MGRYALDSKAGTITFPEGAQLVIISPDMEFFLSLINKLLTKNHIRIGDSLFHVNEVRFDEQLVEVGFNRAHGLCLKEGKIGRGILVHSSVYGYARYPAIYPA